MRENIGGSPWRFFAHRRYQCGSVWGRNGPQSRTIEALLPSPVPELKGWAYLQSRWGRLLLGEVPTGGHWTIEKRWEVLGEESKSALRMPNPWEKLSRSGKGGVEQGSAWFSE